MGETRRKIRIDKKRDVKPTIHFKLYECIARISYITNTPIKDVGETLCMTGLVDRGVLDILSKKFRRDFWFMQTLYKGDVTLISERKTKELGPKRRLTMRVPQETHDRLGALAYALDMTVSSATSCLIETVIFQSNIVNQYITSYITSQIDENRMKELKQVIKYIAENNPNNEEITFSVIINYLLDQMASGTKNIKKILTDWLDQFTNEKS